MALYIRDDQVDALAEKARALLKARTKTDAVRVALEEAIRRAEERRPLEDKLSRYRAMVKSMGIAREALKGFDMKAFRDELSGEDQYDLPPRRRARKR